MSDRIHALAFNTLGRALSEVGRFATPSEPEIAAEVRAQIRDIQEADRAQECTPSDGTTRRNA